MSGIAGLMSLDGHHPTLLQIRELTTPLERRGPEGTHIFLEHQVGLGHTLLATTPEALVETLPLTDGTTGCTITADARIDNREQLFASLDLAKETRTIGDGELILRAYLKWGEECPKRLLGDFAFAIWDPRSSSMMCARDHVGMRQLTYHHEGGRHFVFATEPAAILALLPDKAIINDGRISDYLGHMEGADPASTFFNDIWRLPPAHVLHVDHRGISLRRYWKVAPEPTLNLPSDSAYAEAFLAIFTEAVRCRLRNANSIGAMVSGGIDSNAVAAVAANLLAADSHGPLATFSAIGPDASECAETRAIKSALRSVKFAPTAFSYTALGPFHAALARQATEPFDADMNLIRAVYLEARRAGIKTVLDGAQGDMVLSSPFHNAYLLREGRLLQLLREIKGEVRFWGPRFSAWRALSAAAWQAFTPTRIRAIRFWKGRRIADRHFLARINPLVHSLDQARALSRRLRVQGRDLDNDRIDASTRVRVLSHPNVAVVRERYDRVAAAFGIEPRDPFLDLRLVRFCLSLPRDQLQRNGWPKWILRQSVAGLVAPDIGWRRGKEHLGAKFTRATIYGTGAGAEAKPKAPSAIETYEQNQRVYLANWFANIDKMRKSPKAEYEGDTVMAKNGHSEPKRRYSSPKLVVYGDMATLTKSGVGSQPETIAGEPNLDMG